MFKIKEKLQKTLIKYEKKCTTLRKNIQKTLNLTDMRCLGYYLGLTLMLFAPRLINTVLLLGSLSVTILYVQNAVLDES